MVIVIFTGATLTTQHNNKLNIFLNNVEPVSVSSLTFLYSREFNDTSNFNNTFDISYYTLSLNANQDIKNMSITVIGLDNNNSQIKLPDRWPLSDMLIPQNYVIHSNESLLKGKSKTIDLICLSVKNQNIGSLNFYVYDESNRLNNLINTYNVPIKKVKTKSNEKFILLI
jgi:hypothetical protein